MALRKELSPYTQPETVNLFVKARNLESSLRRDLAQLPRNSVAFDALADLAATVVIIEPLTRGIHNPDFGSTWREIAFTIEHDESQKQEEAQKAGEATLFDRIIYKMNNTEGYQKQFLGFRQLVPPLLRYHRNADSNNPEIVAREKTAAFLRSLIPKEKAMFLSEEIQ